MAITISTLPLGVLVDLVNRWGTRPRQEDRRGEEPLPSPDTLADLGLGLTGQARAGLTKEMLADAADALHPVFAAEDAGTCARRLTRLLSTSGARPALEAAGADDTLRAVWTVTKTDRALLAAAAVTLRQYLGEHGFGRIGVCTGGHCADVYIDQSPGGRRRFCSVTCQNRARVAAFRSRRTKAAAK
ncbi:CGNR zinc finger domain-containing protein [Streptomyces sp. cg35]|uniref:CGNR zinc finger domain-containing protein n=1 Tax=Streptomyces sp. cg35 TaxID=3421650 RepID=UPI003D185454